MSVDRNAFGAETTADEVLEGIDLRGKRALVTGASGGLGAETARALAARGAAVTLTARDTAKVAGVLDHIRGEVAGAELDTLELELSEPESVRRAAKEWLGRHDELHFLINNAGVMACPLARNSRGWEMQFATNHLGHFLFTNLLAPALVRAAPSRVVSVSSGGHKMSPVLFDDPHFETSEYDKWVSYGQAKTANVLFAFELDRRIAETGVRANAIHPGAIHTDLSRHLQADDVKALMDRSPPGAKMQFKSIPAGAATQLYAATAPELEGQGGLYLEDCRIAVPASEATPMGGYAPHALDPEAASRLWALSEELLGERFDPAGGAR